MHYLFIYLFIYIGRVSDHAQTGVFHAQRAQIHAENSALEVWKLPKVILWGYENSQTLQAEVSSRPRILRGGTADWSRHLVQTTQVATQTVRIGSRTEKPSWRMDGITSLCVNVWQAYKRSMGVSQLLLALQNNHYRPLVSFSNAYPPGKWRLCWGSASRQLLTRTRFSQQTLLYRSQVTKISRSVSKKNGDKSFPGC